MIWGNGNMLSRAGKFTEEQHMILKHQDDILSGSPQKKVMVKSQSTNRIQMAQDKEKEARLLKQINFFQQESENSKGKDLKLVKSSSQKSLSLGKKTWSFDTISREHYYQVHKNKYPIPPCGAYNINFHQVDRTFKPLNWKTSKNESKVVKEKVEPDMRLVELQSDARGFIDFKRQNFKIDITKIQATTPHDKRFEAFNYFPNVSTKSLKLQISNFRKTLPRDDKLQRVNLTPSTYNVNFEFLMPKLAKQLVPFNKIPERKPIDNTNKAITNDSIVYDNIDRFYQFQSKYKTIQSPNISKMYPRGGTSPESKLPAFMEGVYDRASLNEISKKMLETNYFSDGQFQSVVSSFEPKKSYRVTQSTFGQPLNESKLNPRLITLNDTQNGSTMKRNMSKDDGITLNSLLYKNGSLNKNQSAAQL